MEEHEAPLCLGHFSDKPGNMEGVLSSDALFNLIYVNSQELLPRRATSSGKPQNVHSTVQPLLHVHVTCVVCSN